MRVIAGKLRGRRLTPPTGDAIRPTSDRMRETLFNILAHGVDLELEGARVADLFAGTGALGIEALSRGAKLVTFVDAHAQSLSLARKNCMDLGVAGDAEFLRADARKLTPTNLAYDLVFMDPPYGKDLITPTLESLKQSGWVKPGSIVVIEFGAAETVGLPDWLTLEKERKMADSRLYITSVTA